MGNFTRGSGGGIGHEGRSPGGLIANNVIAFNEVFYGVPAPGVAVSGDGGGIFIAGDVPVGGALSDGSGSVTVINNLIQGNLAGAGHGGGIRAAGINGADVTASANPADWYALDILNNIIVNNVAGYSAGGISLQDATRVRILNNTIAWNDSTATAIAAFQADSTTSTPQGAGLVSHQHTATLALQSRQTFCDPELKNNIFFHNRSFYFERALNDLVPNPSSAYVDLEVAEGGGTLHPTYCILSPGTPGYGPLGTTHNQKVNPLFVNQQINNLYAAVVIDEAGNNLSVRLDPISIYLPNGNPLANYHVQNTSPAIGTGGDVAAVPELAIDFDREARVLATPDIGADQYSAANPSIIPPAAPAVAVALVGPTATGAAPPVIAVANGAGIPPGPEVPPLYLNPLPGDPLNPLLDPEPMVDSDGDGNPANDVAYYQLSAGDGWATMADGTDLYTFGFTDATKTVTDMTALAASKPTQAEQEAILRQIGPAVLTEGMLGGNLSAPTMVFKEGQHAYLDLSNAGMMMRPDLFDPHTVHFHGFPNAASIFDGEPMASIAIGMGGTLRYYYRIVEPGTYFYHCHVEATEHMQMGMIGNLYVLPKQNNLPDGADLNGFIHHTGYKYAYNDQDGSTYYDVEAPIQVTGFDRNFHEQHIAVQPLPFAALKDDYPLLNGRGYPDTIVPGPLPAPASNDHGVTSQKTTSLVTATQGQKILLRLSNVSETDYHTFTVLGIPMKVVAKDARLLRGMDPDGTGPLLGKNLYYDTTSITIGGGETTDVILNTAGVAPGTYLLYTTRLNMLSNNTEDYGGAMTEIVITAP
ncbi:MAG: multicopper oxidase domain-containing protein [Candidatus Omnitrophica bacterium]|nr:multicopper oxidase domain-containing protein [Candidatus Omnitrophota bacterium]